MTKQKVYQEFVNNCSYEMIEKFKEDRHYLQIVFASYIDALQRDNQITMKQYNTIETIKYNDLIDLKFKD